MLDVVVVDGKCRGIIARNLLTGELERHSAPRRGALHRRLRQRVLPEHQRHDVQHHGRLARTPPRRLFRQPLLHPDPPDLYPRVGRLPVEAHPDVGIAAQRRPLLGAQKPADAKKHPRQIPEADRDYYLERRYPAFGNLVPRDIASRAAKTECDAGKGVGATGLAVYLDFADAIKRLGQRHRGRALRQPVRDV
jgi:succinate dehydrogenase / fumarate reductase flavoprotein subunit